MPIIQPYESNFIPNTTVDTSNATGTSEGAGLKDLGTGLEKLGKGIETFEQHKDTTKTISDMSSIQYGTQKAIRELPKSLNDAQQSAFMEKIQEAIAKSAEGLNTEVGQIYHEKLARTTVDSLGSALNIKNAQLQGKELVEDIKNASLQQSNLIGMNPTPENYALGQATLRELNVSTASAPVIDQALKVHTKSYIDGIKNNQGDYAALKKLQDENFIKSSPLDQVERQSMIDSIKRDIRFKENEGYRATTKATTLQNQAYTKNFQDLYYKIGDGDTSYKDISDAVDNGAIKPTDQQKLGTYLTSLIDGTKRGDPAIFQDAITRLQLQDGDPKKITDFKTLTDEYGVGKGRGLSKMQIRLLSSMFLTPAGDGGGDPTAWTKLIDDSANQLIKPTFVPWGDRPGMANWAKFLDAAKTQFDKKVKAGISPDELLDPKSKNYLGNMISQYDRSREQRTRDAINTWHNPAAAHDSATPTPTPYGLDPHLPTPPAHEKAALTPREQAALDALMSKIPPAKKGGK